MQNKKRGREKLPRRGQFRGSSSKLGQNRGQMQMSFGMIFSIILIVVFLGFAFYAIKTFLDYKNNAIALKFYDGLQDDIDRIWRESTWSSEQWKHIVPSGVDYVCFVDFSSDAGGENSNLYSELQWEDYDGSKNVVFYPVKSADSWSKGISHMDIEKTTAEDNPLCIKTSSGKVGLTLKKDIDEMLVTITK